MPGPRRSPTRTADRPAFLAATRADEASPEAIERLRAAFPDLEVLPVSVIDETSLEAFRDAAWRLTGLIRVRLRTVGQTDPEPLALDPGSTVENVADWVHHDLAASFIGARVWGPSARSTASVWVANMPSGTATWSRSFVD